MTTDERIAELETAVRVLHVEVLRLVQSNWSPPHFMGFPSRLTETTRATESFYSFNSKDVTYTPPSYDRWQPTGADDNG